MNKVCLGFSAVILVVFLSIAARPGIGDEGYVGTETCTECHEDKYESYMKDYHATKGDPRTPAARHGCESCHGPGATHSQEESAENIISLGPKADTPVQKKNALCLDCHTKGKVAIWHGSTHEDRGLSCSDCHKIHERDSKSRPNLTETQLCTRCHQRLKPELLRQSHHPIREGKMKCSDCHNPHGSISDKLIDAQYPNQKCFECHAELRGPYLWEHPSVVEDCLSCHTPHGSSSTPLLKAKIPYLCQRCHSNVGHPSQLQARRADDETQSVYRVLSNRGFYRACLNCHVSIHGSNHPSGKSLMR
jgi:DmsE family decaheme c-type cytochrome